MKFTQKYAVTQNAYLLYDVCMILLSKMLYQEYFWLYITVIVYVAPYTQNYAC